MNRWSTASVTAARRSGRRRLTSSPDAATYIGHDAFKPEIVEQLNALTARFEARGARVLLTFGVFPDGEYTLNQKIIDATAGQLRDDGTFQVVGHPRDFLYPYSDFSDSVNHLRPGARTQRTQRLAAILGEAGVGKAPPAGAQGAAR